MKEADKAEEEFTRALEIAPGSRDAQTGLGGVLIMRGELDRAIEVLTDAAEINPNPQMVHYELGRAYELKGEKDRAIGMYKKALSKTLKKHILPSAVFKCK
jgi:tetratricopeptide (TPR) repeat protein